MCTKDKHVVGQARHWNRVFCNTYTKFNCFSIRYDLEEKTIILRTNSLWFSEGRLLGVQRIFFVSHSIRFRFHLIGGMLKVKSGTKRVKTNTNFLRIWPNL